MRISQPYQNTKIYCSLDIINTTSTVIIAPPTRLNPFRTPSPEPLNGRDTTTRRKYRFFDALVRNKGARGLSRISASCGISESCGRKWQKEWINLGSEAKRRLRPRLQILRRKSKVTKAAYKMLCSPSRNPVRKQPYEA